MRNTAIRQDIFCLRALFFCLIFVFGCGGYTDPLFGDPSGTSGCVVMGLCGDGCQHACIAGWAGEPITCPSGDQIILDESICSGRNCEDGESCASDETCMLVTHRSSEQWYCMKNFVCE